MDRCSTLVLLICLVVAGCGRQGAPPAHLEAGVKSARGANGVSRPQKLTTRHLPNAVRVHERVISGGLPAGDAGFAELKALGVQTVISVDGAKPNVALAEKHGLRYVHLPHGYDGIPDGRGLELAKAVSELPGPVYIHCHHGKHRSPAAAAVACLGAGLIDDQQALATLEIAGTSPHYRGLYQSTAATKPIEPQTLQAAKAEFPAVVEPSPMAEAMVAIEHTHDHLQKLAENQWRPIAQSPDLDAPHEALLLREHFTEMLRTEEAAAQPEAFRRLLEESEADAQALEDALQTWSHAGRPRSAAAEAQAALARVTKNCSACHQAFRDVPLSEKPRK